MSLSRVLVGDWPLTQGYGDTGADFEPPGHGLPHWHEGFDYGCPTGTPCLAPVDSDVVMTGPGYLVLAARGTGARLYYFHISYTSCQPGDVAPAGAVVAWSGDRAVAGGVPPTGPHLHFGARTAPFGYQVDDVDPSPYVGGFLMALTDQEQTDLKNQVSAIYESLLVKPAADTGANTGDNVSRIWQLLTAHFR